MGPIYGLNPPNQQLRPAQPVAQNTRSNPTIRSNTCLKSNHPTQMGRIRFKSKPEPAQPMDRPSTYQKTKSTHTNAN